MAEFCKYCIKKCLGIDEKNINYFDWLTEDGICEGCGYDHLGGGYKNLNKYSKTYIVALSGLTKD